MNYRTKRILAVLALLMGVSLWLIINPASYEQEVVPSSEEGSQSVEPLGVSTDDSKLARTVLEQLEIKGRAPKTGYSRDEFYKSWPNVSGCSLRQIIIKREFGDSAVLDGCNVIAGNFTEPYTGQEMTFTEKTEISKKIQIDHVVALSDAWQKGAQYMEKEVRFSMATDPLNLLAVESSANQQKSDGDAATWLPSNKAFRCQYVARQVSVKKKYSLWVTQAEHDAIAGILDTCPNEPTVGI